MRTFPYLALVVALLCAAPLVQAATVTTNDYAADSVDTDIDKSCKKLDLDSTGKLTGKCNYRQTGGDVTTKDASLRLEKHAECHGGTLQWGSGGFIEYLSGADIRVSSDGKTYLLSGTCTHPTDATDTAVDDLRLDDKLYNSKGAFSDTAP